jgi:triosephosphate isomerase
VVVGHSERRQYHHEDDELINAKLKAAFAAGLTPIFCLGEGLDVRESRDHVAHCTSQIDAGLNGLKAEQVKQM